MTLHLRSSRFSSIALTATLAVAAGCDDEPTDKKQEQAAPKASARPVASVKPVSSSALPPSARLRKSWPVPTGPRLAILKGQGVGPIRLGATVATIERLMDKPCPEKTNHRCRYTGRAVEFLLDDEGVAREIRIHRMDRPTGDGDEFGVFNGRFPEGADFGMYPSAVIEVLGKPDRVEKVDDGGATHLVEIHHYPGMRLEYDRVENGNVVLSGVVITRPGEPKQSAAK